jgi:hypothetical protein
MCALFQIILEGKEQALILLSGSENRSISNIKSTFPNHTALIFNEQAAKTKRKGVSLTSLLDAMY